MDAGLHPLAPISPRALRSLPHTTCAPHQMRRPRRDPLELALGGHSIGAAMERAQARARAWRAVPGAWCRSQTTRHARRSAASAARGSCRSSAARARLSNAISRASESSTITLFASCTFGAAARSAGTNTGAERVRNRPSPRAADESGASVARERASPVTDRAASGARTGASRPISCVQRDDRILLGNGSAPAEAHRPSLRPWRPRRLASRAAGGGEALTDSTAAPARALRASPSAARKHAAVPRRRRRTWVPNFAHGDDADARDCCAD